VLSLDAVPARRESDVLYEQLSARLRNALVDGNVKSAEQIADQALAVGQDAAAVEVRVIAPAMRMIGELWEQDAISVADEHLATAISHQIVARLFRHLVQGDAGSRARVMLAATQGEHHILGLRMTADVLQGAGYEVMYLGSDQTCRFGRCSKPAVGTDRRFWD
jgi:MerR family transcriptional regulator, light-induced transcriptional regulator